MNAKQKEALTDLMDVFQKFVTVMVDEDSSNTPVKSTAAKKTKTTGENSKGVNKETPTKEAKGEKGVNGYSAEELEALGYNGMKALAKELGFIAKGDRTAILEMLMNQLAPESPSEKSNSVKSTKAKKVEVEEDLDDDEDDEDDEDEDPIVTQVNEAVADMTDEQIADYLTKAGINPKGKRQALIASVVKGVRSGKCDLDEKIDDEDDEDDGEEVVIELPEIEGIEDLIDLNDPDSKEQSEERSASLEAFANDTRASFEEGELSKEDLAEFIIDFFNMQDKLKTAQNKKSGNQILEEYIIVASLFIDDEGEIQDSEDDEDGNSAYTIQEIPFCCGYPLSYDEEENMFICEVCGGEYPGDDE